MGDSAARNSAQGSASDAAGQHADLPSLTALTAFEATLRLGSFTAAARELDRTQGAVSRQVALLESQLGRDLFHREHPGLRPTRAAVRFGERVARTLTRLRSAVADVSGAESAEEVLHLALLPTFGTTWLIPRLPAFLDDHPDVSVELSTTLETFDFDENEIDAAIHYGAATWPGGRSEKLMQEQVVVVCAPHLAKRVRRPDDLVGEQLLQIVSRPKAWSQWVDARELGGPSGIDARSGPRFEHHMMAVEAARSGLGFALLPDFVAESPLQSGALVEPFPGTRLRTNKSYWLVYPERSLELPGLLAFRAWIREEARRASTR